MVVAVVGILSAVMMPSLAGARAAAKMAACAVQVHQVGVGLASYTADARHRWPPFLFSESSRPNLPLSGHYGGEGPESAGRKGDRDVNLHALGREGRIRDTQLRCPGTAWDLPQSGLGVGKFSDYCLRMPYSNDLWPSQTPPPKFTALDAYRYAAGGQSLKLPSGVEFVSPQLREDRQYARVVGGGVFDPARDVIVSDRFVDSAYRDSAGQIGQAVRVGRTGGHAGRFNVLVGDGAVRRVDLRNDDTATTSSTSLPPGTTLADAVDDDYNAAAVETVWQRFDAATR